MLIAAATAAATLLAPAGAGATDENVVLSQGTVSRWAYVVRPVAARAAPRTGSRVVTIVRPTTPEHAPNLVLALASRTDEVAGAWVRVRLAILPTGSTGWVPRQALGPLHTVRTRLVVDRGRFQVVLYRGGAAIFRARIGVGRPQSPTPRGRYYVREKLDGFGNPFYGPTAFGTSARSRVLTDWPGGGYIGIHGTDAPQILPGRVSHGCIRLRNDAIRRLARVLPLGTPVTIR